MYYADLDEETGLYCVFHTETSHAYESYTDMSTAVERANKRNK